MLWREPNCVTIKHLLTFYLDYQGMNIFNCLPDCDIDKTTICASIDTILLLPCALRSPNPLSSPIPNFNAISVTDHLTEQCIP